MPDLLAHVLLAYALGRLLSYRLDWITQPYVTMCMVGAILPDLSKINLIIQSNQIEARVGIPFDWFALHTAGGVFVLIALATIITHRCGRKRVFVMLTIGAISHLIADGFLRSPSGRSYAMLWPLTRYHPPTPGWYLSTDPLPTVIAFVFAGLTVLGTYYSNQKDDPA